MTTIKMAEKSFTISAERVDGIAFPLNAVLSGAKRAARVAKGEVKFAHGDDWANFDYGDPRVPGGVAVTACALSPERAAELVTWATAHGAEFSEKALARAGQASPDAPFIVGFSRDKAGKVNAVPKWGGWRGWMSYAVSIKLLTGKAVPVASEAATLREALHKYMQREGTYRGAIERKMAWREARAKGKARSGTIFALVRATGPNDAEVIGRYPTAASAWNAAVKMSEDGLKFTRLVLAAIRKGGGASTSVEVDITEKVMKAAKA